MARKLGGPWSAPLVASIVMLGFWPARADEAPDNKSAAQTLFREASRVYATGDYAGAARLFEASHQKIPRAAAIYNAALAWDAAGELARAADAYDVAIDKTDLHGPDAERAHQRLTELSQQLATVTLSAPPGTLISIAHVQRAPTPLRVHLLTGSHVAAVEWPSGAVGEESLSVSAGESYALTFAPPPPEPLVATSVPPPVIAMPRPTLGWVLIGAAGVLAAGATATGVATLSAVDDYNASGESDARLRTRAVRLKAVTNIGWGAAVLSAATGLGMLFFGPDASLQASLSWDGAGVVYAKDF